MPLAVLEINDAALTIRSETGDLCSEPGFARITGAGIETGESARAAAWLEPQSTHNRYWQQLNETPLPVKTRWARHGADIAYTQLQRLFEAVGWVDRCALVVPGSFSSSQLGLLLGMVKALGIQVVAVVETALAALLDRGDPGLFVDFQLHQGVVSVLEVEDGELRVGTQEVMPELGVIRLYSQLARAIAGRMIETSRFDPLHDPATEQWIFDNLPAWLRQLQWQGEQTLFMPTPSGERRFRLEREQVAGLFRNRLAALEKLIAASSGVPVAISHTGAVFAGLHPDLDPAMVVDRAKVADNCLEWIVPALGGEAGLRRYTAFPVAGCRGESGDPTPAPLYLLHSHRAFSLAEPVSIAVRDGRATLTRGVDTAALLSIVQRGGELEVLHRAHDVHCDLPGRVRAGTRVEVQGVVLPVIEVSHA